MKPKHSPAPFRVDTSSGDLAIYAEDGYNISSIPICEEYGRGEEDRANADLFAAAPDLFAVCEYLATERNPNIYTAIDMAMKALEKATGRKPGVRFDANRDVVIRAEDLPDPGWRGRSGVPLPDLPDGSRLEFSGVDGGGRSKVIDTATKVGGKWVFEKGAEIRNCVVAAFRPKKKT